MTWTLLFSLKIAVAQKLLKEAQNRKREAENTLTIATKQQCLLSIIKEVNNIDMLPKGIEDGTQIIQDDIKKYNIECK